VYIYCSNESPVNVYFDNIQVVHTRGALLEETHYYPFGLVMAGISSKAAGKVENKYKFNSIEQNNDFDINTYDAFYRTNDPQLGRWWQIDPKGESFFGLTPYNSMGSNPVKFNDPLGDIFDDASQKFIDAVKESISTRQKALNTQRTDLKNQIAEAKKSGDKDAVKSLKGQLKEVNSRRAEMNAASTEINRMESDKQLFMIREFSGANPFGENNNATGVTTYSKGDNAVVFGFKTGDYASLIHEFKHGYDFLVGEMSFIPSATFDINDPLTYFASNPKDRISSLHDMPDEYRAFDRYHAYLGTTYNHEKTKDWYYSQGYILSDNSKNLKNTVPPKREVIYKTQKN
jgi:RHS repeat-associated protein